MKEQIEYKGMIIKELAAKTGISKRTIDTYVDSRAVIPNAEIAVKLAEALNAIPREYLPALEAMIHSGAMAFAAISSFR